MVTKQLFFVSDTHLSPDAPEAQKNWAAVVRYVTAAAPDLVIHLGDLSLDGARNPADLDHARGQLEMLPVPWAAVPGNHDIGANPLPGRPEDVSVTEARRQRWLDVVGADHWALTPRRHTGSGRRLRGIVSPACSPAGHRPCSSVVTCTSPANFTSTEPVMSGRPRRGLSFLTTRSRCSALSAAACCRWLSEPDSSRSRPSSSRTASGS